MRANVQHGLFTRQVRFETSDDGERTWCVACGALVLDRQAHRDFHAALQQVARDADEAASRPHRIGW